MEDSIVRTKLVTAQQSQDLEERLNEELTDLQCRESFASFLDIKIETKALANNRFLFTALLVYTVHID